MARTIDSQAITQVITSFEAHSVGKSFVVVASPRTRLSWATPFPVGEIVTYQGNRPISGDKGAWFADSEGKTYVLYPEEVHRLLNDQAYEKHTKEAAQVYYRHLITGCGPLEAMRRTQEGMN